MSPRAAPFALLLLVASSGAARAEVGWAGAVRVGVGGPVSGPRAGTGNVDLGLDLQAVIRKGAYDQSWGAGPFFDARTLDFQRHDVTAGVVVSTPDFYNLFAGGLQVGAGYRWLSDAETGAVLHSTFLFHVRIPLKAHEEMVLGIYTDARVLVVHHPPTELTTGIEIDPVGLIAGLYQRTRWEPPR